MRRTRLGTLLLATGWACFPLALVSGSLAPAFLGVLLVAVVTSARAPGASVEALRELPEGVVAGAEVEVVTRVAGPKGAPVFVSDEPPPDVEAEDIRHEPGRGRATLTTRFRAPEPGVHAWNRVHVRVQDPRGLVEDAITVPLVDYLEVKPEPAVLRAGERAGRSEQMGARSRTKRGFDALPELDRLRDFQPGDRFRDVDWAHSAKLQRLIAREFRREAPRPVVVLLQASSSMRWQRRVSKLATAGRAALAVVAAARSGGLPAGFVAWSEGGVEARLRVSGDRKRVQEAAARVASLPQSIPLARLPDIANGPAAPASSPAVPSPDERSFLMAAATFLPQGGGAASPVEAALTGVGRASPGPSLVVAFLDAEESPSLAITVIRRLVQKGHRVVVAVPASGAHHYGREEADARVVRELVRWRRNREEVRVFGAAHQVPVIVLHPSDLEQSLGEVVRSAA